MKRGLVWLRRDLRLHDHHALSIATKECDEVYLMFNFDPEILKRLGSSTDRRIDFIINHLIRLNQILTQYQSQIFITFQSPQSAISEMISRFNISALYFNRDYEPYAKQRDRSIIQALSKDIHISHFKDHVIYERHEVLTNGQSYFKVFTPYYNKWLQTDENLNESLRTFSCDLSKLTKFKIIDMHSKEDIYKLLNFKQQNEGLYLLPLEDLEKFRLKITHYKENRDFPHQDSTSKISPHLRFGTISIRDAFKLSNEIQNEGSVTWKKELIWREFYQMLLDVNPHTKDKCFLEKYNSIKWPGQIEHFELWCKGQTGFPIIDSAMRCLNQTGEMHNRLRMIVASFLTKTLLIDWKLGERYFASQLLDFDLAANVGGWQWAASVGADAQPYFRIFNPYLQSEKFDKDGMFIKKWCPELAHINSKEIHCPLPGTYIEPIVDYKTQKQKALDLFNF